MGGAKLKKENLDPRCLGLYCLRDGSLCKPRKNWWPPSSHAGQLWDQNRQREPHYLLSKLLTVGIELKVFESCLVSRHDLLNLSAMSLPPQNIQSQVSV